MWLRNYSQIFFYKIKIEHVPGSTVESFMPLVFIVCQIESYQNILKLICKPLAFTSYKAFLKNKKRSRASLSTTFWVWFFKKNVSHVMFPASHYVYCNFLLTISWRHKFWNWPYLSNQAIFLRDQKLRYYSTFKVRKFESLLY